MYVEKEHTHVGMGMLLSWDHEHFKHFKQKGACYFLFIFLNNFFGFVSAASWGIWFLPSRVWSEEFRTATTSSKLRFITSFWENEWLQIKVLSFKAPENFKYFSITGFQTVHKQVKVTGACRCSTLDLYFFFFVQTARKSDTKCRHWCLWSDQMCASRPLTVN